MRLLLVAAVCLVLAAPARAGTYEHHTLSPESPGLDGWTPSVQTSGGFVAADALPDRLALRFWARPWFLHGEIADWIYATAPDTTMARWELERTVSGVAAGDWNTLFDVIADGRWHHSVYDVPSRPQPWAAVSGAGLGADRLVARLACGGPGLCWGGALMELRRSRMLLHDGYAPTVSAVQGELASERVVVGPVALSFAATDRGGGVYRAWAEVDGRAGTPVAIGDGRCRDVIAGGDPYQFAHRRPCPLEAGATVAVDTTGLTEGRHVVSVHVEDAAGNRTTVFGPAARTVDNVPEPPAPAPSGPEPSPAAMPSTAPVVTAWLERRGRRRSAVTIAHGERVRLRGRVTDPSGRPLANAPVEIAERVTAPGGDLVAGPGGDLVARPFRTSWRIVAGVRTRPDGRFAAVTRVGPSRRLRIASGGSVAPRLTVRVRAPVTAQLSAHGGVLVVRGRVRGGYVPRGGALVELQGRSRRGWVTERIVRTSRSGRFSGRVGRHPIRVRVPRQAGLPYEAGLARARLNPRRRGRRTGPRTSR